MDRTTPPRIGVIHHPGKIRRIPRGDSGTTMFVVTNERPNFAEAYEWFVVDPDTMTGNIEKVLIARTHGNEWGYNWVAKDGLHHGEMSIPDDVADTPDKLTSLAMHMMDDGDADRRFVARIVIQAIAESHGFKISNLQAARI